MQLNCKHCGAEIPADNINLDRMIAKCSVCNSVFSFADQFDRAGDYPSFNKLEVPLPKGFTVDGFGGELKITRRWFGTKFMVLAFFALFWNGFMVVWYGIALWNRIWPMAIFGLLHAAIGLWLIYYVLAGFVNKTVVRVNLQDVQVSHGPIPYPGNKRLNRSDIEQLYCKEQISRGRRSTSYSYQVHAVMRGGKQEKLLTGLDNSDQALFVEQEIERYLGIKDQPVRGEWGR